MHAPSREQFIAQAVRAAQSRALEVTAGFLALQTIKGLRALREECGVIHETKAEALVSAAGQVAHKAYERFLTVVERAESLGIDVDPAIRKAVLASDIPDNDVWAEIAVRLAHYEPQFGVASRSSGADAAELIKATFAAANCEFTLIDAQQ